MGVRRFWRLDDLYRQRGVRFAYLVTVQTEKNKIESIPAQNSV